MGASVDYLQRHPATGRLSFRRAFPPELRALIPEKPRELKRSLAATRIEEPGAMDRYRAAAAEYDATVALARKAASGAFDSLDAARSAWIIETFRIGELHRDALERSEGNPVDPESIEAADDAFGEIYASADREAVVRMFGPAAIRISTVEGWRLDEATDEFAALCRGLLAARMAANEVFAARAAGQPIATPVAPPPLSAAVVAEPAPVRTSTFSQIVEGMLSNPRLAIGAATRDATRSALRFLGEAIGDLAPRALTRRNVSEFMDLLALKPARPTKQERALPLPELVERYRGDASIPRLSGKTINQHVGSLGSAWNLAQNEGLIPEGSANPFAGRRVAVAAPAENPQQLSDDELRGLFALPIFTSGERPVRGKGEAAYWIPLLLLFTGARPEEIAQLLVSDVRRAPEDGRWLLRITDEGEHPVKGRRSLKTEKKRTGRREFPIHQVLLDLGFLAYVRWLQGQGEVAIFPQLRVKNARGNLFPSYGEWWSAHVQEKGIVPSGQGRRPSRELRHLWSTNARRSNISEAAMEYIQGHSTAGKSANVRYGDRSPLGIEIDRYEVRGLNLRNVRPWAPPQDS